MLFINYVKKRQLAEEHVCASLCCHSLSLSFLYFHTHISNQPRFLSSTFFSNATQLSSFFFFLILCVKLLNSYLLITRYSNQIHNSYLRTNQDQQLPREQPLLLFLSSDLPFFSQFLTSHGVFSPPTLLGFFLVSSSLLGPLCFFSHSHFPFR